MKKDVANLRERDLLIIVDLQNDFFPGGALVVPNGNEIVGPVNALAYRFPHLILTQDWHPREHLSFASNHTGREPFETIVLSYGDQVLWPDHCVQGTWGAEFHAGLEASRAGLIARKGQHVEIDSYSAFFENDHKTPTGLAGYLRERRFERLYIAGLATDFSVRYTAIDGRNLGFEVAVIEDACRAIDIDGSCDAAWSSMRDAGVKRLNSADLRFPS